MLINTFQIKKTPKASEDRKVSSIQGFLVSFIPLKSKVNVAFSSDVAFSCSNLNKAQFGKPQSRLQQVSPEQLPVQNRNEMLQSLLETLFC